jgi:hypothetical protein
LQRNKGRETASWGKRKGKPKIQKKLIELRSNNKIKLESDQKYIPTTTIVKQQN